MAGHQTNTAAGLLTKAAIAPPLAQRKKRTENCPSREIDHLAAYASKGPPRRTLRFNQKDRRHASKTPPPAAPHAVQNFARPKQTQCHHFVTNPSKGTNERTNTFCSLSP
ncbi:hypothetical protein niasHS_007505 [Heterodera schachtii]|uniref:Uncharacterized protein n=1 Tax=Heterodera schachtii TaxID=97005 RepID=A0ABD2JXP0_HETSC